MFENLGLAYVYTAVIAIMHSPVRKNFGAETHLGGGDVSAFCLAAERSLRLPLAVQPLRKGTRSFWPHGRDRWRSLALTCRNASCWRSCERCNEAAIALHGPHVISSLIAAILSLRYRRIATAGLLQECGCPSILSVRGSRSSRYHPVAESMQGPIDLQLAEGHIHWTHWTHFSHFYNH